MNKEFNGFDEMVEALEENEDMVECKECFDLVPKVDCERTEVGYICPTCKGLRTAPAQARFVDPYDSYTQDFPEVTDYDPDSMVEYEKEPGLGDALSDLIRDEYEAINGYEIADETVQRADIDEDEKDEILDTLDHIKKEEEEHIDELKELCPECDSEEPEKLEEAAGDEVADEEDEVEEIPEEDIPEEEAEDSEENENEEVADLDSAYEAALEIANESGVGQVFGYARKETEEFVAIEPFEVDDPDAVEDDLMAVYDDVAYAYVAYPEKGLEESLYESVQLNEGPGRFLKGLGQKIGNAAKHVANKDSGKLIDKFFNEGYTLIFEGPKDGMPDEHKSEYDTADQALTAALHLSKEYPKYKIWVFAKPIDESDLTPREKIIAKAKNGLGAIIGCFRNGTALQKKDGEIADTLKKIEIDKQDLMKTTGRTAGERNGDPRDSVGEEAEEDEDPNLDDEEETTDPKDAAKKMLGKKEEPDGYTPESYKRYEAAYNKIVNWIENHKNPKAITQERIDGYKGQAVAKLKAADEELNLDDETEDLIDTPSGTDVDSKEEEVDTEIGAEDEESAGEEKISEISDDRLIKLYQVLSGKQISSDTDVAESQLKRLRQKLASLGESIDNNSSDEELLEVLQSEAEAVKSLKDTAASLKATASSMQNMTSAMREEYHKYANPAELKAMEDIENLVSVALSNIYNNLAAWGYNASETDSQCWMSQENEACLQYMIDFEDLDDDETEDLADQLQMQLENELSAYKPVPEIEGIAGSIALPDYDIAYDDDDEDFKGITRGSIMVYVTFARNLF